METEPRTSRGWFLGAPPSTKCPNEPGDKTGSDPSLDTSSWGVARLKLSLNGEARQSTERSVQLCAKDSTAFRGETFSWKIEADALADARLEAELELAEDASGLKTRTIDPYQVLEATASQGQLAEAVRSGRPVVLLLYDSEWHDMYSGRVLLELEHREGVLQARVASLAQLQMTVQGEVVVPFQLLPWLIALTVYFAGGICFFMLYMGADAIPSVGFAINVVCLTGQVDIMAEAQNDEGEYDFNRTAAEWFLIFYMVFGVVTMIVFLNPWFNILMLKLIELLDGPLKRLPRWLEWPIRTCSYGVVLVLLLAINVVMLSILEDMDFTDSLYLSTAYVITLGYVSTLGFTTNAGKIWLLCWLPFATLFFVYVVIDVVQAKSRANAIRHRDALLEGLLREPEDLVAIQRAQQEDQLTRYQFIRFMMIRLQCVDEEDLQAIEQRFDFLDKNNNGIVELSELEQSRHRYRPTLPLGPANAATADAVAQFNVGDQVRVWWSMLEPAAWYSGEVVQTRPAGIKVKYLETDDFAWHDPAKWQVEKWNRAAEAYQGQTHASVYSDNDYFPTRERSMEGAGSPANDQL